MLSAAWPAFIMFIWVVCISRLSWSSRPAVRPRSRRRSITAAARRSRTPTRSRAGGGWLETQCEVKRVRLEQTQGKNAIATSLSLACSDAAGTKENSWYRIFHLADFGVDKPFQVNRVNFGVQTAIGDQRIKVSIGTYDGNAGAVELDTTKIDMLGLTTIGVPEGKGQMLQAN